MARATEMTAIIKASENPSIAPRHILGEKNREINIIGLKTWLKCIIISLHQTIWNSLPKLLAWIKIMYIWKQKLVRINKKHYFLIFFLHLKKILIWKILPFECSTFCNSTFCNSTFCLFYHLIILSFVVLLYDPSTFWNSTFCTGALSTGSP